jgi:hypothetical protein
MKNNIIYLNKLHIHSNDKENISYCENKCTDKNSLFMYEIRDYNQICPECLNVIQNLSCDTCISNEQGLCDTMNCVVHKGNKACYMHIRS